MVKRLKSISSILVFVLVMLSLSGTAIVFAESASPGEATYELPVISNEEAVLTDPNEIETRRKLISSNISQIWNETNDEAAIEQYLKSEGLILLEPISTTDAIEPLATDQNMVSLTRPQIFWDNLTQDYTIYFNWEWKMDPDSPQGYPYWKRDFIWSGDVGGRDGWGIQLTNDNVLRFDSLLIISHSWLGNYTRIGNTPMVGGATNAGGATQLQDRAYWDSDKKLYDYDAHKGTFFLYMKPNAPKQSTITIRGYMGHSWNQTDLNGVTVSTNGLTFTWTLSENRWDANTNPLYW